jgi:hypothetical protein
MTRRWLSAALVVASALLASAVPSRSCSLSVTPQPGESRTSGSRHGSLNSGLVSSNTGSKTVKRNMKWRAEVRIRGERPQEAKLKVYYLAYDQRNRIKELKKEEHSLSLDKNNRAELSLVSPMTSYTKSRTRSSGNSRGFSSIRSTVRGERIAGAAIQLFVDGALVKSWVSDSRWEKSAEKDPFSVDELQKNSGRLGGR